MKKVNKIIIVLIIFLLINIAFANVVKAEDLDSVVNEATSFIDKGKGLFDSAGISTGSLTQPIKPIAQALRTIGIGIILCIGAFMGIKWVTAKPDEQAKLKQQSIGLLVAAIVVIGAFTIWEIVLKIVSQL